MTPTLATITLQLFMARDLAWCGLYRQSNAHYDKAMDAIYWLECPTKDVLRSN